MATKNISRTIIEGGRAKRNKEDRWESNQQHRSKNREFSKKVKSLVDADDAGVTPERKHVMKGFDDKLGAVYRWLRSNTGRQWNDVYSELRQRFDMRTTAGRHIIVDHVLGSVARSREFRDLFPFSSRFYVDDDGVLQVGRERNWRSKRGISAKEIYKWADGRRVMDYGKSLFWMVPKTKVWVKCGREYGYWYGGLCYREHRDATELVKVETKSVLAFEKNLLHKKIIDGEVVYFREKKIKQCHRGSEPYRQGARFNAKDLEMWAKLSQHEKDELLWVLPVEDRKKLPYKSSKRLSDLNRPDPYFHR